ncbi:MAG: prepilin-type N-terminal cleavage/methylation domain-containing protein [Phycisphaerales bacterium]
MRHRVAISSRGPTASGPTARGGFTMLELMLALTIGALAMLLAGGIFFSINKVDSSSERAHRMRAESYITQTVMRDSFMSLMMVHGAAQDDENPPDPSTMGRARIILEPDAVTGNRFQRLEVVLRSTPLPGVLQGPAARLAFLDEDAASLNFASADGAGGSARCVFELRPDGERERVMRELGIENPMTDLRGLPDPAQAARLPEEERGWSLWWRRMTADETELLDDGYLPWDDGLLDSDSEARRLASSVRLASGLQNCRWKMFHRGDRKLEYVGWTNSDLPAYAEIEMADRGAEYASWMFEIGWAYGEPEDIALADGAAGDADNAPGGTTGNRTGGGSRNLGGSVNLLRRTEQVDE